MNHLELQRLVDGQLTHAQRAELLGSLPAQDPQWRTLAMLLLEEQQWSKDILIEPPAIVTTASNRLIRTLLACCALFAIGLYTGFLSRSFRSGPFESIQNPSLAVNSKTIEPATQNESFEFASPWRVRVDDPSADPSATPVEIPLVDARDIHPQWILANNDLEIAKLNQLLKPKGYQLDAKPTVYSGSLEDGRKVLVPIHNVSLKPYGL